MLTAYVVCHQMLKVFRQLLPVIIMLTDESIKVGPGAIPPALVTGAQQAVRFVG